jgi:hypothetical protein
VEREGWCTAVKQVSAPAGEVQGKWRRAGGGMAEVSQLAREREIGAGGSS